MVSIEIHEIGGERKAEVVMGYMGVAYVGLNECSFPTHESCSSYAVWVCIIRQRWTALLSALFRFESEQWTRDGKR